jgi:hypothetical protein
MHKPGFAGRQLIFTIAIVSAAALALTVGPAAAATPRCPTSGLVVWLDTQGNGAAGSIFYNLMLTNLTGHACTLAGYPGVSAVNLAGVRLGSPARRNAQHTPHTITLTPGASAKAVLQITEAANFPSATCRRVTAAGLRVYPPNQTASKIVPFPFQACSRSGPVFLSVEAVQHA